MAKWDYKLGLGDLFNDEALALPEKTRLIQDRLRSSDFYRDFTGKNATARDQDKEYAGYDLEGIVDELGEYGEDEDLWNQIWDQFYDWCDEYRVWIDVHDMSTHNSEQIRAELTETIEELK